MSEKFAKVISTMLHPFLVGVALLFYLIFFKEKLDIYQLGLIVFLLSVPMIFIIYLLKKKVIKDLDISDVHKRKYFYFPTLGFLIITLPLSYIFRIPASIILFQIGFSIWIFCWAIISLFYKISGHTGGAAFIYGIVYFLIGGELWWFALLLIILAWSRVKLRQHTIDQTILGAILGFLISIFVFKII